MVVTKTKAPGASSYEPLVRAFEEIRPGKVHVLEKGLDAPRELAAYGPLVYVGDDPFTLDERGWPVANAGCLFLPDLTGQFLPELTNPVFVTARVNHGEGFIAMADAIQRVREGELSPDEEYKLVTEFYSPARIIGQHRPDFLVRQENVPEGAHLAELGKLFARHVIGVPPMRARIDVRDNYTRNAFIKSGRRYLMEPLHMTSRGEADFLARNQGTTEHGVNFYYAPTGERYLTVDQLRTVAEDYESSVASARTPQNAGTARELLAGRLEDI